VRSPRAAGTTVPASGAGEGEPKFSATVGGGAEAGGVFNVGI
jgi:hypothetical protein